MNNPITIETTVQKDIETVWQAWNTPEDIMCWLHASNDWECSKSENDLRAGGKFSNTMGAKDKSVVFDMYGYYDEVRPKEYIAYTMGDGRKVTVNFEEVQGGIHIIESFEPENENSREMQQGGWQAILENFRMYVENK